MQKVIGKLFIVILLLFSINILALAQTSPYKLPTQDIKILQDRVNVVNSAIETLKLDFTGRFDAFSNRFAAVEKDNLEIRNQIKVITQRLASIEVALTALKKANQESQNSFYSQINNYSKELQAKFGKSVFYAALAGIVIILILFVLMWLLVPCRKKTPIPHHDHLLEHEFDKMTTKAASGEYDQMKSKEGVAAKLNLARAYIDMGKKDEAKTILNEVMLYGEEAQIVEAKGLLEKIQ